MNKIIMKDMMQPFEVEEGDNVDENDEEVDEVDASAQVPKTSGRFSIDKTEYKT